MAIYNKCCICKRLFEGDGYNAKPYKAGRVCAECNSKIIQPAKINLWIKGGCKHLL